MPSAFLLARTTMAAAFDRTKARIRRSMYSSPGNHGSCSRGMVLMYGVLTVAGKLTCLALARSRSLESRKRARVLPCTSTTASSESSHSWVSPGSESGSWLTKPSKIMTLSQSGLPLGNVREPREPCCGRSDLRHAPPGRVEQGVRGDQRRDAEVATGRQTD